MKITNRLLPPNWVLGDTLSFLFSLVLLFLFLCSALSKSLFTNSLLRMCFWGTQSFCYSVAQSSPTLWDPMVTNEYSSECSGLISFRIDWFALLAVQGTQESSPAPQFESIHSSALSILYGPTLSLYMTTGKTIALTMQIFVGKVMSLLFNTLSRCVIAFLPRSKHLLMSWLQSPSAVICIMWFWNKVGRC